MKFLRFQFLRGIDWSLFIIPLLLLFAGIAVIYSLSPQGEAGKLPLYLLQGVYGLVGLLGMGFLTILDYRALRPAAPVLFGLGLLLLLLVLFVGSVQFGARRWIDVGPIQVQPSELMKLFIIVVLAWFFAARDQIRVKDIVVALLFLIVPVAMVIRQPDFGTAILLVLGAAPIFFLSRISREQWIGLVVLVLLAVPVLFLSLQPYQRNRLESFFNPARDPFGAGYNVLQSTIAIGSGGLTGRGLGQGSQSVLRFVPVAHTDFIFAGVAEATGFVGSATLLALFGILIFRAMRLALTAQDRFGRLMAAGISSLWLFSVFINVGMNMGLVPVTGIPLPFVSFGGSALVTNLAMAGVLQSIHLRQKKIFFS